MKSCLPVSRCPGVLFVGPVSRCPAVTAFVSRCTFRRSGVPVSRCNCIVWLGGGSLLGELPHHRRLLAADTGGRHRRLTWRCFRSACTRALGGRGGKGGRGGGKGRGGGGRGEGSGGSDSHGSWVPGPGLEWLRQPSGSGGTGAWNVLDPFIYSFNDSFIHLSIRSFIHSGRRSPPPEAGQTALPENRLGRPISGPEAPLINIGLCPCVLDRRSQAACPATPPFQN